MTALRALLLLVILVLRRHPVATAATSSETASLLAFRAQIVGDPLGVLSSWSASSGDPCGNFSGVSCSASGDVVKILLHSASLSGPLPTSLSRLPSLRILSLFDNLLSGGIPPSVSSLPSLRKLNLSRNSFTGGIPPSLAPFRLLDLSRNRLSGPIPPDLFSNCNRARFVSLAHNSLSGAISPSSFSGCPNLRGLDLSSNNLTGGFPAGICTTSRLEFLSLGSNSLGGPLGEETTGCRSLVRLDLGGNSFDGAAPFQLLALSNMTYFNLSFNRFSGEIPEGLRCGNRVEVVDIEGNEVGGRIAGGMLSCAELRVLNLQSNRLVGSIPAEISRLRSLSLLRLGGNAMLGGKIPPEIGAIDLLVVLDLHSMNLSGAIPDTLTNLRFLLELDLSGNHLDGEIPQDLHNITYLKILNLHDNLLTGGIPPTLGTLDGLEELDLSHNSLTGTIPETLGDLVQLRSFNLSYNRLSGQIPSAANIQKFGASAFSHNAGLCGAPLENSCTGETRSRRSKLLSVSAIVAIVAAAAIVAGVCLITAVNLWLRSKKVAEGSKELGNGEEEEEEDEEVLVSESLTAASGGTAGTANVIIGKLVLFSKRLPSRYEDWEMGTKALLDKDCIIGGGTIGTVYRASLEGGIAIAVKKLETLGRIRSQDEFEQEMGRLGSLRHQNLVQIQGYYWSTTMQLLLMELVPNGNLSQHLHSYGSGVELDWSRRFGIALGTARALAFLHHDCKPQILHLNVKAANVLLDEDYEAKLSDYGLVKMLPMLGGHGMSRFHSAAGYVAPEIASQSLSFSDRSDVYSFGVVLLEIVSGRKPVERSGNSVVVLCDDVRRSMESGSATGCFDRRLRGFAENELIQVLKLGLICTVDDPARRPSMAEVVQFLESVKPMTIKQNWREPLLR